MAPTTRKSTFSSRVTLYEPSAQPTPSPRIKRDPSASTSAVAAPPSSSPSGVRDRKPKVKKEDPDGAETKPKLQRTTPLKASLATAHAAPKNWEEVYGIIRKQRETFTAPVDEMGCEQGGRESGEVEGDEKARKLSTLVSLMLSSQTKDPVTHFATMQLRKNLRGGLSVEGLLDATPEEINACIAKVGFHNIKTKNLAKLAIRLRDEHGGEVPEDLLSY